jgi:hypothetical protein
MASRNNPTISRERLSALFNRTDEPLRQWEARRTEQLKVRTNYAQCADPEGLQGHRIKFVQMFCTFLTPPQPSPVDEEGAA